MAGIVAYYYVGGAGGFNGGDGLNGLCFDLEVWAGDREALSVNYHSYDLKPISLSLKTFVPKGPNDEDKARRAMILFASNLFEECPSFEKVKNEMGQIDYIDFSSGINVPAHFNDLLEESRNIEIPDNIYVYFAPLKKIMI